MIYHMKEGEPYRTGFNWKRWRGWFTTVFYIPRVVTVELSVMPHPRPPGGL